MDKTDVVCACYHGTYLLEDGASSFDEEWWNYFKYVVV